MAARKTVSRFGTFGTKKREAYLRALREGNSRSTAARQAGVSRELVRQYRHATEGWAEEEAAAEEEAHGQVEDALFQAAVSGNVTAIQVWLYNRRPERWKDRRNHQVTGKGGGPIKQAVIYIPDNGRDH
jgi:hypothetical protein